MKQFARIFLVFLSVLTLVAILASCGSDPGQTSGTAATTTEPPVTEHVHAEVIEPGCEPTCSSAGYTERIYCRECGETLREAMNLEPLPHNIVYHEGVEPTCLTAGFAPYERCTGCEYTTYSELPALSHELQHIEGQEPTCEQIGWAAYEQCLRCNYTTYSEIPEREHELEQVGGKEPTCDEGGWAPYEYCLHCEYSTYQEITPAGHLEVSHEPHPATCTEDGYSVYITCAREGCDWYYKETETALGHDTVYHDGAPATCTVAGWEAYETCLRCDTYTTYQPIAALGHAIEHYGGKPATCTEDGWHAYEVCSRCSEYDTYAAIPALGHDLTYYEKKQPTCTEPGHNAHEACTRCEYSTKIEEYPHGHFKETIAAVPATCETFGSTAGERCWVCGEILVAPEEVPPLGHATVSYDGKAATCTEDGWEPYERCTRCEYTSYIGIPALDHDRVSHAAKEPTCLESGWYSYETCNRCSYNTKTTRSALGHSGGIAEEIRAATCVKPQLMQVSCVRCSKVLETYETHISSDAHSVVIDTAVAATCVAEGLTEGKHCELCQKVLVAQKPVPATAVHCTVDGACTVCRARESTRGLEYELTYDGDGYVLVGLGDYQGSEIVIGTYNNLNVVGIALDPIGRGKQQIKKIVFAEGSRCSEDYGVSFAYWEALECVVFGKDSYTRLHDSMFFCCTSLHTVTFEEGCRFVGNMSYDREGAIPASVFWGCSSLTSIALPPSIEWIGPNSFYSCDSLMSVTIPASVKEVMHDAFFGRAITLYVEQPYGDEEWKRRLNEKEIPVVWNAGSNNVANDGNIYTVKNGIRYAIRDGIATVVAQPYCLKSVTIPSAITYNGVSYPVRAIGERAFYFMPDLVSVTLPSSLVSIKENAFYGCHTITSLTIPASVIEIEVNAFGSCVALTLYAEATAELEGWEYDWGGPPVVWDSLNNDKDQNGYCYVVQDGIRYAIRDGEATVVSQPKNITVAHIAAAVTYRGVSYPVTEIFGAFYDHWKLTSVTIPASVRTVASSAFESCENLSSVIFAEGSACETIGSDAFRYCSALSKIILPEGVQTIGSNAFQYCELLSEIILPASLRTLEELVFYGCSALSRVSFADGSVCESIAVQAFCGCRSLTAITIPASVTEIGFEAFCGCSSLATITVEAGNTAYKSLHNALYTADGKTLLLYAPACTATAIVIPEGVTVIEGKAFGNAAHLVTVTLPSTLLRIGKDIAQGATAKAFRAVGGVIYADTWAVGYDGTTADVVIREGTVGIADSAFEDRTGIYTLSLPTTLTILPASAFASCTSLVEVTFAEGSRLTYLPVDAFRACLALEEVVLPLAVETIGEAAFSGCTALSTISIPSGVTAIGAYAFSSSAPVCELVGGVYYVGGWAVGINTNDTVFSIREGTVGIAPIFTGYASVERVTIPASVRYIMHATFQNCASLLAIEVDGANTQYCSLDGDLYSKDGSILYSYAIGKTATSFVAPEGLKVIATEAFYRATNLVSVDLTGVERIGEDAFFDSKKLKNITFSSSLTAIEEAAFSFCTSLTSMPTIPSTVTEMGSSVFYRCDSLKSIQVALSEKPEAWDEYWNSGGFHTVIVEWLGEVQ